MVHSELTYAMCYFIKRGEQESCASARTAKPFFPFKRFKRARGRRLLRSEGKKVMKYGLVPRTFIARAQKSAFKEASRNVLPVAWPTGG